MGLRSRVPFFDTEVLHQVASYRDLLLDDSCGAGRMPEVEVFSAIFFSCLLMCHWDLVVVNRHGRGMCSALSGFVQQYRAHTG